MVWVGLSMMNRFVLVRNIESCPGLETWGFSFQKWRCAMKFRGGWRSRNKVEKKRILWKVPWRLSRNCRLCRANWSLYFNILKYALMYSAEFVMFVSRVSLLLRCRFGTGQFVGCLTDLKTSHEITTCTESHEGAAPAQSAEVQLNYGTVRHRPPSIRFLMLSHLPIPRCLCLASFLSFA